MFIDCVYIRSLYTFLYRYGAMPLPPDGGTSTVIALLDKLIENGERRYTYQLVSCLDILLKNIPLILLPFMVSIPFKFIYNLGNF